jgi:seryl-tRNA synthetase
LSQTLHVSNDAQLSEAEARLHREHADMQEREKQLQSELLQTKQKLSEIAKCEASDLVSAVSKIRDHLNGFEDHESQICQQLESYSFESVPTELNRLGRMTKRETKIKNEFETEDFVHTIIDMKN